MTYTGNGCGTGVTDSGGEGLFLIIEGMSLALKGNPIKVEKQVSDLLNKVCTLMKAGAQAVQRAA